MSNGLILPPGAGVSLVDDRGRELASQAAEKATPDKRGKDWARIEDAAAIAARVGKAIYERIAEEQMNVLESLEREIKQDLVSVVRSLVRREVEARSLRGRIRQAWLRLVGWAGELAAHIAELVDPMPEEELDEELLDEMQDAVDRGVGCHEAICHDHDPKCPPLEHAGDVDECEACMYEDGQHDEDVDVAPEGTAVTSVEELEAVLKSGGVARIN